MRRIFSAPYFRFSVLSPKPETSFPYCLLGDKYVHGLDNREKLYLDIKRFLMFCMLEGS